MSLKRIIFVIVLGIVLGYTCFSCKSVKTQKEQKVVLIKGYKTPVIGGAGSRGMKITLTLKTEEGVELKSIEYNQLINPLTVLKTDKKEITAESYFYDKNEISLSENTNYKAEGDFCTVHYLYKNEAKSLVCENLIELKDSTLWE